MGKAFKRIPGAVVCHNVLCPRRLTTRAITTNRDLNGALNIALIGFSRLASTDGLPLPPLRRINNTNKYTSCPHHFQPTNPVREESPHKVASDYIVPQAL